MEEIEATRVVLVPVLLMHTGYDGRAFRVGSQLHSFENDTRDNDSASSSKKPS